MEVEEYVRRRCKEENSPSFTDGVDGAVMDYPYATCCSLNDEVAHAFPRHYILKDGDLLKVDMVMGVRLPNPTSMYLNSTSTMLSKMEKYTQTILVV